MRIKVGGTYYEASPSFMTLLRFRARFDRSYLAGQQEEDDTARLVYAGIVGDKPDFDTFWDETRMESTFRAAAAQFRRLLLRPDGPQPKGTGDTEPRKEYEYAVLGVWASLGLHFPLLEELTLAQATHLMQTVLDMRNPKRRPQPMTREQRSTFYAITPDREARVMEYLAQHPGKD